MGCSAGQGAPLGGLGGRGEDRSYGVDGEQRLAELGYGGGVVPVGIGRGGGVGELRGAKAELLLWSARAEEGCSGGSAAASSSPELRMDGGGVLRRRSGEKVKEREDQVAGVLVVLMRTRERGPGL